jgi:hypothetical protein
MDENPLFSERRFYEEHQAIWCFSANKDFSEVRFADCNSVTYQLDERLGMSTQA